MTKLSQENFKEDHVLTTEEVGTELTQVTDEEIDSFFDETVDTALKQTSKKLTPAELQKLITAAQANNQEALNKLCEQFKPLVEATGRSHSCYSVLGEDGISVAWLVFIKLIRRTQKKVTERFPGYVKRVLYTKLINEINKTAKEINNISLDTEELNLEPSTVSFEDDTIKNHRLLDAIKQLSPEEQQLLYSRYFQDISMTGYAKIFNKKESTVRMQHLRILKKLHKLLEKH